VSNIFGVIESKRMGWAGYVAHMAEMVNSYRILVENMNGRDHMLHLRIHWNKIKLSLYAMQAPRGQEV
jgi:hypothetical protein